jgi:hypothetical protein
MIFQPQTKVVVSEQLPTPVVDEVIPNEAGLAYPQSAAHNDEISCSPGRIRAAGSVGDCLAGVCPQNGNRCGCIGAGKSA